MRRQVLQVVEGRWEQVVEHVFSLAAYLPRREFGVVVAGELDRAHQETLSRLGVRWVGLEMGGGRGRVRQLQRLIQSLRADLVHSHGVAAGEMAVRAAGECLPVPVKVYTAHELSGFESGAFSLPALRRSAYRRMLASMDAVIALSRQDRQALGALAPGAVGQVEVVPPGVDTRRVRHLTDPGYKKAKLGLGLNSAVVGAVVDLHPRSGVEVLLDAAAIVNEELPNVEFALVGDGPLEDHYRMMAHRLKLTGATVFLGRRHDLPEVLATLNVVVVASEAGGGVQTALQALYLEIPVVAVDTGGLKEVLEGVEGATLVPPGDARAMAAAIRQALEQVPQGRGSSRRGLVTATGLMLTEREMLVSTETYDLDQPGAAPEEKAPESGSAGQRVARQYSVGRMVRRTVHLYRRLLAAAGF